MLEVVNYIPTASDDPDERMLRRIVHEAGHRQQDLRRHPRCGDQAAGLSLNEGHHGVCIDGRSVAERRARGSALRISRPLHRSVRPAHHPGRLPGLALGLQSELGLAWHVLLQLKSKLGPAADLTAAALLYDDIYTGSGPTPVERELVREPVTPAYDRLHFTDRDDMAVLPPVLDMMEFVVDELRAARMSSAGYAEPAALEARTPARAIGKPVAARALADESRSLRNRFQSFWYGGVLSPYEQFCLKSFVDCGYAVDLYTYDPALAVPAGVRVCDAAEFISRDEVFAIRRKASEKGRHRHSPTTSVQALVEKGGWWIDTDVVARPTAFPPSTISARQDADLVACGTMYFEPRHPIMLRCLEQAIKLGRSVKWGDTAAPADAC
jgi:hypothetical protein